MKKLFKRVWYWLTLRGHLVYMHCGRKGQRSHTKLDSHGICPECLISHYPTIAHKLTVMAWHKWLMPIPRKHEIAKKKLIARNLLIRKKVIEKLREGK